VTHWVTWMRVSSALLRMSGVDSRFVNARFQILGRSICVAAECECVSRSIPDGKGGVGEDAPRKAWPRALSQYGASWASCFDGGFVAIVSDTELAVSRASSGSISSDSEESKDVRRSDAACERYGCESFERYNKWVAKVLLRDQHLERCKKMDERIWLGRLRLENRTCPTRIHHGCACSGGGGFDKISRTASAALRRTLGRGSMVCSTAVLNALQRAAASKE